MSDIKINNSGLNNVQQLNQEAQIDKQINRSGNFQGQSVNTIQPPTESPLQDGLQNKSLNATLAKPPSESPFATTQTQGNGYSLGEISKSASTRQSPSNEALFDFASGKTKSSEISKFLEQDPAASKAVDSIRRGSLEIGSPDNTPKLDKAIESRLSDLASKIFIR